MRITKSLASALVAGTLAWPAYGWSEEEQQRLQAAMGDTIVILPVDAATGQNISQTLGDGQRTVVRTVICMDTQACKEIASLTGKTETLLGNPYSLAEILKVLPVEEITFYTSYSNASWASGRADDAPVFYVSNSGGGPMTQDFGGTPYLLFYSDARQADSVGALAAERLGPLSVKSVLLRDLILGIAAGQVGPSVLYSPDRNAHWVQAWQEDSTRRIMTATD